MRNYKITPATKKITIDTLDLVDRGKWINPNKIARFFTLNTTSTNPIFTALGWQGIASVTVDLQGLRDAGVDVDNPHNPASVIFDFEKLYKKNDLGVDIIDFSVSVEPPANPVEWFNETKPKKSVKIDSIPDDAIALDDSSRRYKIEFSKVLRYRNFSKAKGYCVEDYFCLASDAPNCVKEALNY